MSKLAHHWPAAAALALLYAVLTVCLAVSLGQNDGRFTYALDDPYIHMATAKNLAVHGVAGVTRYGYSSSSSSIGWPLLLCGTYLAVGVNDVTPLVLNVLCATALIWMVHVLLNKQGVPPAWDFFCLLAVAFCTPLPAIVLTGLEHTLHTVLAVAFVYLAARSVSRQPGQKHRPSGTARTLYFALPPLITLTRYEGALMIGVVCLLLTMRRRLREAAVLGLLGATPVLVNGLVAMAKGWHFLPNPVLLKGHVPPGSSLEGIFRWFRAAAVTMFHELHLTAAIAAALLALLLLYRRDRRHWTPAKTMLWIFLLTTALHVQLAKTGWFFRYEAYLMAAGLFAVFAAVGPGLREDLDRAAGWRRVAVCCAAGVLALPCVLRAGQSLGRIPAATARVYRQQYQMATFLDRYYTTEAVAANDVGAINFYADVRNLDLWGLASLEVADARLQDRYGPEVIRAISARHGVKVAMVFDSWFQRYYGGLPPQWQRVGQWEIPGVHGRQNLVVSFYAVDPQEKDRLAEHLREFSLELPEQVVQRGAYLRPGPSGPQTARRKTASSGPNR